MLTETWVEINVPRAVNLALVLDASESAQVHWREILRFVKELAARLRGSSQCRIYFLGDTEPHTIDDFESQHNPLFARHRQRASVLGPLLELLSDNVKTLCIVLCAGRIFDLEDWIGTPIAERLLLVNFGDNTVSGDLLPECRASMDQVMAASPVAGLLGTPRRLELMGNSVMPFFWDNHDYRWQEWKLAAENAGTWQVHVGVLCLNQNDIQAIAITSGTTTRPAELVLCSPQPWLPNWAQLSKEDSMVLRQSIQTGQYLCPLCGNEHPAENLRCRRDPGSLLGKYVYSFLQAPQGAIFVLLKNSGEDAWFAHYPCEGLRVGQNSVAMHSGNKVDVYEFDPNSASWRKKTARLKQYTKIQDGIYAIAV
jgi:hypothetical protein